MSLVSIVIPTKNAGPAFEQTLEAIFSQEAPFQFEVVVIDSGSTDQTLSICARYPVILLQIPSADFGHGATRNRAIRQTTGQFIVLTVQDAVPVDSSWLVELIRPLRQDPRTAGAYSRQIPGDGADFFTQRIYELWRLSGMTPFVREIRDRGAYDALSWREKAHFCAFSNVSSAIRREVWQAIPFPEVEYAEDLAWAKEVLERGYRLAYVPRSAVIHSHHNRPWMDRLRRAYVDGKVLPRLFNASIPVPEEEAIYAVGVLLKKELRRPTIHRLLPALIGSPAERGRCLSYAAFRFLLGPASPWMPGSPTQKRRGHLVHAVKIKSVQPKRRKLLRWIGRAWGRAGGSGDWGGYLVLQRLFAEELGLVWKPWLVFWGEVSARAGLPVPIEVSNRLLGYARKFLPAPPSALMRVWQGVLIDIAGKYLGEAAHAAGSHGKQILSLERLEKWILGRSTAV